MSTAIFGMRILLVVVFGTAAVSKALDPSGTRQSAEDFGLPAGLARAAVIGLPALEIAAALGLLVQPTARFGALAALLLLLVFAGAIARLMRQGQSVACHCFGQLQSATTGWWTLSRNLALAAVAAVVAVAGPGLSVAGLSAVDLLLTMTSASSAVLAVAVASLRRENRELRSRPAAPVAADRGLPPGTALPELELHDLMGETVALGARVGIGRPTLLVQVGLACAPCHQLMPALVRWSETLVDSLGIVVVSSGDLDANREFAGRFGLEGMLVDEASAFPFAFDVRPTPSAVLIDGDGRIAAPPMLGAPAIEVLVRSALRGVDQRGASAAVGAESLPAPVQSGRR